MQDTRDRLIDMVENFVGIDVESMKKGKGDTSDQKLIVLILETLVDHVTDLKDHSHSIN